MTTQEIEKLVKAKKQHPEAGRKTLMKLTGMTENKVQRFLQGEHKPTTEVKSPAPTAKLGRSLNEFRSTYDKSTIVPARVKAALREMGSGAWEYEVQFARAAGVSLADLANFRDMFAEFVVPLKDRRAWAGSVSTAKTMREMI